MIDTLSMAENLTSAGVEQKQAKAIAQAIGEQHGETASKQDIDALKENMNALKESMNALKESMNAQKESMNALKESMSAQFAAIKWIVGANAGLTLVLLAAILAG